MPMKKRRKLSFWLL